MSVIGGMRAKLPLHHRTHNTNTTNVHKTDELLCATCVSLAYLGSSRSRYEWLWRNWQKKYIYLLLVYRRFECECFAHVVVFLWQRNKNSTFTTHSPGHVETYTRHTVTVTICCIKHQTCDSAQCKHTQQQVIKVSSSSSSSSNSYSSRKGPVAFVWIRGKFMCRVEQNDTNISLCDAMHAKRTHTHTNYATHYAQTHNHTNTKSTEPVNVIGCRARPLDFGIFSESNTIQREWDKVHIYYTRLSQIYWYLRPAARNWAKKTQQQQHIARLNVEQFAFNCCERMRLNYYCMVIVNQRHTHSHICGLVRYNAQQRRRRCVPEASVSSHHLRERNKTAVCRFVYTQKPACNLAEVQIAICLSCVVLLRTSSS